MSTVGLQSPFLEDDEHMSLQDLLCQLDHSDLSDLLRSLANRTDKRVKLRALTLIHRKVHVRVFLAWKKAADQSYLAEKINKLKAIVTQASKDSRGGRTKGRIPVVEIKSGRKEPVPDIKHSKAKKSSDAEADSRRSTSTGRNIIGDKNSKPTTRPDTAKSKNPLSTSTSPKRVLPKTFKSPQPKSKVLDRSSSASKRDLNSSGFGDKSARSDRSQSPVTNIGTRLYLQAEELKIKKEKLRQAYESEHEPTFAPSLNSAKGAQKKLTQSIVSTIKSPKIGASSSVVEPKKPPQINLVEPVRKQEEIAVIPAGERSPDEFGFGSEPDEDELEEAIATIKSSHRTTEGSNESYLAEEEKSVRSSTVSYQDEDIEQSIQAKLELALMRQMQGDDDIVIKKIKTTMGKYA